jgi:hypothetical protein
MGNPTYHILTTKSNGVQIITDAWSSVLGPSILVWLAGDVRRIRPTTNFYFRSLQETTSRRRSRRPLLEDDFESMTSDSEPEVSPGLNDYKTFLELIDQYLPVDQIAGKFISPAMLSEFGLLEDSPLDNLLNKVLTKDVGAVRTDV